MSNDIDPKVELLPSEIGAIEAEVQKQIDKEARDAAKKALRETLLAKAKRERGLAEPHETIIIDLPAFLDRISLDNRAYLQGMTYTVRQSVGEVLRDVMQSAWEHQAVIDGKNADFYRRQLNSRVLPGGGVVNGTNILRA